MKMAQQKQKFNKQLNTRNHLKILIESGIENVENLSKLCNTSMSTVKRVKRALKENSGVERKSAAEDPQYRKRETNFELRVLLSSIQNIRQLESPKRHINWGHLWLIG
jgi:hypothetical protein